MPYGGDDLLHFSDKWLVLISAHPVFNPSLFNPGISHPNFQPPQLSATPAFSKPQYLNPTDVRLRQTNLF
jgi:hypothetical protein